MPPKAQNHTIESIIQSSIGIDTSLISQAKELEKQNHKGLLENLIQMGHLSENQAVDVQAQFFGSRIVNLNSYPVGAEATQSLTPEQQKKYSIIPLRLEGNILTVATASLFKGQAILSSLQKEIKYFVNFVLVYPSEINERLSSFKEGTENIDSMLLGKAEELISVDGTSEAKKLADDPHGPVSKAVNFLIAQGVNSGASDIHFEPFPNSYRIRYREDGILKEIKSFDKVFTNPFTAALKVMASIDIAETRKPQDGSFSLLLSGRDIDFRVATYPTKFGEKIVIRILDSNNEYINIDSLMLQESERKKLVKMVESPWGIILVAGPTGSGKTTTLYGMLNHLNDSKVNILTIEDPIEYRMQGVTQAQVNNLKGFTFSVGLRAMMRLDPDVILVGEMRDQETAEIGLQASLTGHMVLSTVHANSASQTVTRLMDLGVEPFIVASALTGVVSQRLVRRLCQSCKEAYAPSPQELSDCGFKKPPLPTTLYRAKGCHKCTQTGYKGRLPLAEILSISNPMRADIAKGCDAGTIFKAAIANGMLTMNDDARLKVQAGLTSLEEYIRVLGPDRVFTKTANKAA